MSKTTDNLIRIMQAGGGIETSSTHRSADNLVKLARVAAREGVPLVITDVTFVNTESLVRIAEAGGGKVLFRF